MYILANQIRRILCTKVPVYQSIYCWPTRYQEYCVPLHILYQSINCWPTRYQGYCEPLRILYQSLYCWPTRYQGYLTSVLLAWMNARCVSFSLDRIWGEITINHIKRTNILYGVEMEIFPPRFGTIRAYWVGLPAPRLLLLLLTPRHHGAPCVKSNLQRELLKNTPTNKQVNFPLFPSLKPSQDPAAMDTLANTEISSLDCCHWSDAFLSLPAGFDLLLSLLSTNQIITPFFIV